MHQTTSPAQEARNDLRGGLVLNEPVGGLNPRAVEVAGLQAKNDGNNVSLDREARLLAENAMRFSVAASLARAEIRAAKSAIQEGKGV